MCGAIGEAALVGAAAGATTKFGEAAVDKLLETQWNGTRKQRGMIEDAVKSKTVLGTDGRMRLREYADSPILNYLKKYVVMSAVYVAYVPSGMGKTTACQAFIDKYVKKGTNRGLGISPVEGSNDPPAPFFDHMVRLLLPGFDITTSSLPEGLLGMLLDSLERDCSQSFRSPSYLFLDDFMVNGPNNHDTKLLLEIKRQVRTRNIGVVALTSNRKSADFMLTLNDMQGICPPLGPNDLNEIRLAFPTGFGRGDPNYRLDWEHYMDMEWPADELKRAMKAQARAQQITDIDTKVDAILSNLTPDGRKALTPFGLLQQLVVDELHLNPRATYSYDDDYDGNVCGLPGCKVM